MDLGVVALPPTAIACFGRADAVETHTVTGWFVAPDQGRSRAQINAFVDGESAGQAVVASADGLPADAPAHARGFRYEIPWSYQDGLSHVLALVLDDGTPIEFPTSGGVTRSNLRFRFAATGPQPDSAPSTARSAPTLPTSGGSEFVGLADPFSGPLITGWAVRRTSPRDPVRLRMFVDGQAAGGVGCEQARDSLRDLGLPATSGGFAYMLPARFLDGSTHSLSILFEDGTPLSFHDGEGGTRPKLEFTAEPVTAIEGVVDGLHGDRIKGWVVRKHLVTGASEGNVRVQVLCNGIPVGEIAASQPRMDVAREYRCDPCVGFEFKLPPQCRNGMEFEFVFKALPEGEELAGCPLPVKHRRSENGDELRALNDTVGELCATAFKLQRQMRDLLPADASVLNYDGWARRYLARLRARMAAMEPLPDDAPLVSIVMPAYRTNLAQLTAAIESVRAQSYANWELIVADDGSRQRALTACLKTYAAADERITCVFNAKNRGISSATNAALRRATGHYVLLMDHDDLLVEVALEALVREVRRTGARVVYADEDKIDEFGELSEPNLKPDWNYRLLLGVNYICHPLLIEWTLLKRVGLMRKEYDGAQDHDLLLRLAEKCAPEQIRHLPEILYHWRKSATSTASSGEAKPYAIEAGRRAVADHLNRRGFASCQVQPVGNSTTYRVDWGLTRQPNVTIIVPFKDQIATTRRCLEALLASTHWPDWRVVLVDNGSVTPEAEEFCRTATSDPHVIVRRVDEPFNFSRLNNDAARAHPAEYYVFLNNDVFLEQPDWLQVLMGEALADPKVAVVGAKLIYPNGTVQHAGVVLGVGGIADHAFRGIPADHPGYLYRARCAQRYSAVTAACMLCRADAFMDVGGFDEQHLMVAFNDVDLCLRIGRQGGRVIWTPDLVAEHHESLSRGDDISPGKAQRFFYENHVMLERWHDILPADPFYNPHFSRDRGLFSDLA